MTQGKFILFATMASGVLILFVGFLASLVKNARQSRAISPDHDDVAPALQPPPLPFHYENVTTMRGLQSGSIRPWQIHFLIAISIGGLFLAFHSFSKPEHPASDLHFSQLFSSLFLQVGLFAGTSIFVARASQPSISRELSWQFPSWKRLLLPQVPALFFVIVANILIQLGTGYAKWTQSIGEGDPQFLIEQLRKPGQDPRLVALVVFTAVVIAPICEELLFRGFVYRISRSFLGPLLAGLASGLIFGAIHGNLSSLPVLVLMGMVLAFLYEWSGSLWTNILFHAIFNGSMTLILFLAPQMK